MATNEFRVVLNLDNDEFASFEYNAIAAVFHELARDLDNGKLVESIYDSNGNRVGRAWFTRDYDEPRWWEED